MSVQCVHDYDQLQYDTEHTSDNLPDKHQSSDVVTRAKGPGAFLTRKVFKEYIHYKGLNKERIINSGNFKQRLIFKR